MSDLKYRVVAQRQYTRRDCDDFVTVSVFAPYPCDEGDYVCKYEICGLSDQPIAGHAFGVDSMQALLLVLEKTGIEIIFSDAAKENLLFWLGRPAKESGLVLPGGLKP